MRTIGIVLAGGLSRRFGSPKAFAMSGDKHFYEIAVDVLSPLCDQVVIVTRPELIQRHREEDYVLTDIIEFAGLGPLAGILSGMESVEADRYVVLPTDMPYVTSEVLEKLMGYHKKGITAVISEERRHPLVSIWDNHFKNALRNALENERLSVMRLLDENHSCWIPGYLLTDNEELVFTNVNTPDVLERG
ncbi:molybdenum cofactor guanylyltransferase [Sporosarcina siberiensis]|uniref:Probable molybdenum cofactor guanylyltransferase n=1 Tax=Sporosarcina siberiensis TaxID=1365606 RepID=A0ABW4SDJ7_9BACL